jgi:nucleotide-binding universal stress UspA family protein
MKILLPVHAGEHSLDAVAFVASRCALIGADPQIVLLNVQQPAFAGLPTPAARERLRTFYAAEAAKSLDPAKAILAAAGLGAQAMHVSGQPGPRIAHIARLHAVDLIVLAGGRRAPAVGALLGSVATEVLARCRTPVLLLRSATHPPDEAMRVGIAIDGSVYGNAAVKFVVRHRALFGANPRYSLIHVERKETGHPLQALLAYLPGAEFPVETARPNQQSAFEHTMRTPRRLFSRAGIEAQEVDLVGAAGDAIAEHAQRTLDLLVMGSHGHGLIWSAALDATTMHVASRCTIPLLLIRRP